MIRFESDYLEGACAPIMAALAATNLEQTAGYGMDPHCEAARGYIKALCGREDLDVHFLVGGTQANQTVIASILRPHQGVLSAQTGHINVHETGAIEATGHKVIVLHSEDGKLTASQVQTAYDAHWGDVTHEHMTQPGMVYISHPTENGTTYTKAELTALSATCRALGLPLFMDGARLGYGLSAAGNDLFLHDIACLCDVFYIGGTKVGALFGEAVVIPTDALKKDFRYHIKQRGGMLAKGRLLGIQFEELMREGLYMELGSHAVDLAMRIRDAFARGGYSFRYESATNQQFPILPEAARDKLAEKYTFSFWEQMDKDLAAVRFCTSWATRPEDVERLIADIQAL